MNVKISSALEEFEKKVYKVEQMQKTFNEHQFDINCLYNEIHVIATTINKELQDSSSKLAKNQSQNHTEIIKFNIGGTCFSTFKYTLSKKILKPNGNENEIYESNLLELLMNGEIEANYDENNTFFIDRSPKNFNYILDYLRTANTNEEFNLPNNKTLLLELEKESKYYKVGGLKEFVRNLFNSLARSFKENKSEVGSDNGFSSCHKRNSGASGDSLKTKSLLNVELNVEKQESSMAHFKQETLEKVTESIEIFQPTKSYSQIVPGTPPAVAQSQESQIQINPVAQTSVFRVSAPPLVAQTPVPQAHVVQVPVAHATNFLIGRVHLDQVDHAHVAEAHVIQAHIVQAPVFQTPTVLAPTVQTHVFQAPIEKAPVFQAPIAQAQVFQAPNVQAPVFQDPFAQAQVFQAPTVQAPTAQASTVQAPFLQTPPVQSPAFRAPYAQAPVLQTPIAQVPVFKAPVFQAPFAQAPVFQAPFAQAPVFQAPIDQAPVFQAPIDQAPVFQAPTVQAPVFEAPIAQAQVFQAPTVQAPTVRASIAQAPVFQAPVFQTPAVQNPVFQTPIYQATVYQAPSVQAPVVQAPVVQAPVVQAPVVQAHVVQASAVQIPTAHSFQFQPTISPIQSTGEVNQMLNSSYQKRKLSIPEENAQTVVKNYKSQNSSLVSGNNIVLETTTLLNQSVTNGGDDSFVSVNRNSTVVISTTMQANNFSTISTNKSTTNESTLSETYTYFKNCMIAFLVSSQAIYIQKEDFDIAITKIQPIIDTCLDSYNQSKTNLCIGQFDEDEQYYRCRVLDWSEKDNKAKCVFIDFGNTADVSLDTITKMGKTLRKTKPLALYCRLHDDLDLNSIEALQLSDLVNKEFKFDIKVKTADLVQFYAAKDYDYGPILVELATSETNQLVNKQSLAKAQLWKSPSLVETKSFDVLSVESKTNVSEETDQTDWQNVN